MAELCVMCPDGAIIPLKRLEENYEFTKIFKDIASHMRESQLGVCATEKDSAYFVPISQMMLWNEKPRDIGKEVVFLGKKIKKG